MEKRFLIYQTTEISTGRFYRGRHECHSNCHYMNSGICNYKGSGKWILSLLKKRGSEGLKTEILFELNDFKSMVQKEIEVIDEVFEHPLNMNFTPGGDGWSSEQWKEYREQNPDIIERNAQRMIEIWKDPEFKNYMSESTKTRWADPEYKERVASEISKRYQDENLRKQVGDSLKAFYKTELGAEKIENMSIWFKEMWEKEGYRENKIAQLKEMHKDPLFKAAHKDKCKIAANKPERLKTIAKHLIDRMADPEERKKHSAKMKEAWARPGAREERTAKLKLIANLPESKKGYSLRGKKRYENPLEREKASLRTTERFKDPKERINHGKAIKAGLEIKTLTLYYLQYLAFQDGCLKIKPYLQKRNPFIK